jgi:Uma2 family endonuclease
MATGVLKKPTRIYGPDSNGIVMTPRQFDRAEFAEGYRYELINGVLVVSSTPSLSERDPNQALGRWLLDYQEHHPEGIALDFTIHEHIVQTGGNRRHADRVIWSGLGRLPKRNETPAIVVEFVSAGKRNIERDYETKRDEYLGCGVREYWIFDRFEHSLTVFQTAGSRRSRKRVFTENQIYSTDLLPGFRLHLERLFALADRWSSEE